MDNKEIKLSVNNLKVSFRTDGGKVQAVRDINFDLYKGETLAIVGESGSGKSVTSKAIMGISAVNSIYEGGEILYDGQDLIRIPEEEMHKLRGDKIAMIFQDPLSSLNPIMRIGRQITEAMLLKNKANRKEGKATFNKTLAILSDTMKKAIAADPGVKVTPAEIDKLIKTFDNFNIVSIKLDNSYSDAKTAAEEMISMIEDFLFLNEKNQKQDTVSKIKAISRKLGDVDDKYFTSQHTEVLKAHKAAVDAAARREKSKTPLKPETVDALKKAGLRIALATNPIFPSIATEKRIRWAGFEPEDFVFYTTYENSRYCKPNPNYYKELLKQLNVAPEECLMVGNDVGDDMVAEKVGMKVFLLTDCLINKTDKAVSDYPNGGFSELRLYVEELLQQGK